MHLGQVPVVEGDSRSDAGGQQLVDQVVVVVHSCLTQNIETIDPALDILEAHLVLLPQSEGQDTGPGDGEPVAGEPHGGQQRHVLLVLVVGVAGHVPVRAVLDVPLLPHEQVPDVQPLAVLVPGALDLTCKAN